MTELASSYGATLDTKRELREKTRGADLKAQFTGQLEGSTCKNRLRDSFRYSALAPQLIGSECQR